MTEQTLRTVADLNAKYGQMDRTELYKICKSLSLTGINSKSRKSLYMLAIAKHLGVSATESDFNEVVPRAKPKKHTFSGGAENTSKTGTPKPAISNIVHFSDVNFCAVSEIAEYETLIPLIIEKVNSLKLPWRKSVVVITGLKIAVDSDIKLFDITEKFMRSLHACCGSGLFIFNDSAEITSKFADTTHFITEPATIEFENVVLHYNNGILPATGKTNVEVTLKNFVDSNFNITIGGKDLETPNNPKSPLQTDFGDSPDRYFNVYTMSIPIHGDSGVTTKNCSVPNPYAKIRIDNPKTPDEMYEILEKWKSASVSCLGLHIEISAEFDINEKDVRKHLPDKIASIKITRQNTSRHYWNIDYVIAGDEKYVIPDGVSKIPIAETPEIVRYMLLSDNRRIKRSNIKFAYKKYGGEIRTESGKTININCEFDGKKWAKCVHENSETFANYDVDKEYKHPNLICIPDFTSDQNPKNSEMIKKLIAYFKMDIIQKIQVSCNNIVGATGLSVDLTYNKISAQKNGQPVKLAELQTDDKFILYFGIVAGILATTDNTPKTAVICHPINSENIHKILASEHFKKIVLLPNSSIPGTCIVAVATDAPVSIVV